MGRRWTYTHGSGGDLTSVTDPMNNVTTYTYGAGSTGNPQLANDLLTITKPNGQAGGPDAGDSTVNVYGPSGRVTSQTGSGPYFVMVTSPFRWPGGRACEAAGSRRARTSGV